LFALSESSVVPTIVATVIGYFRLSNRYWSVYWSWPSVNCHIRHCFQLSNCSRKQPTVWPLFRYRRVIPNRSHRKEIAKNWN